MSAVDEVYVDITQGLSIGPRDVYQHKWLPW